MKLSFHPTRPTPILFLSDAPECLTGLARIGRDLAALVSTLPQFRVGYLGRGGVGRRKFPWTQYSFPEQGQWGEQYLPTVWNDFSQGENGIVMSLWDASRMIWFGAPHTNVGYSELEKFLGPGRSFEKWGYFPIDGVGPNEQTVPMGMQAAIAGYDRVVTASEWAVRTVPFVKAEWIPHGIFSQEAFHPTTDSKFAPMILRSAANWNEGDVIVGCVMTNQARKDWPIAFQTASLLKAEYGNRFKFWAHTDTLLRYWNLQALAAEYGVLDCTEISMELTDAQLAARYSACDCTILPSAGEGFGYPIAESMACGTACIVSDYAAGPELVDDDCKAGVVAMRIDSLHNVQRAVLSAWSFAGKAKGQIEAKRRDWTGESERHRKRVEHLDWSRLRTVWEKWFLEGLKR